MANFLGNLGAAFQGQQNYQAWEIQQEQAKLRIEAEKENLAQIKDLAAEAKEEKKRKPKVAQGYIDFLTAQGQGIPPPPPPSAKPPAPGQASVPMIQPGQQPAQYGQRPIGPPPQGMPPQGMPPQGQPPMPPGGGAPMPQGGPPMPQQQGQPPQGQMQPQQGSPQGQPGQPPIPPYRTVQGAPQQPQMGPQGIPPPPQQQQQAPRPGSMTLADAAQFIKAQGITDPTTSIQILEKLTPYLDQQAQQQANQLKQQQLQQDKERALQEKAREADQRSRDTNLSREDRREAQKEANETRKMLGLTMASIAQQNANTKAANAGGAGGAATGKDGQPAPGVEAASWDYLIKGTNPPSRGGVYSAVMKNVEKIAKDNNMSVQELTSASADVKTKLAAKRSFEVRAQNMERAENQILAEIPLAEQAIKGLNLSSIPAFQKGGLAALRATGDPRVTTLDQSLETIFNEFEGIKTGNPGALNVSDVQNARHNIENATTEKQLNAAIAGMRRIMNNAKSALDKSRSDTMKGINDSFKKEKSDVPVLSNQAELAAAIKSGKLKKGDTFTDPSGTAHTVN